MAETDYRITGVPRSTLTNNQYASPSINMIKYVPTANYLLLKPTPRKEMTEGGLFIPDMSQDKINEGTM